MVRDLLVRRGMARLHRLSDSRIVPTHIQPRIAETYESGALPELLPDRARPARPQSIKELSSRSGRTGGRRGRRRLGRLPVLQGISAGSRGSADSPPAYALNPIADHETGDVGSRLGRGPPLAGTPGQGAVCGNPACRKSSQFALRTISRASAGRTAPTLYKSATVSISKGLSSSPKPPSRSEPMPT